MPFVLLIQGQDSGCDYTIACNVDYQVLDDVSTMEAARKEAMEYLLSLNEPERREQVIKTIMIYEIVGEPVLIEVQELRAAHKAEQAAEAARGFTEQELATYQRLKKQFDQDS